MSGNQLKADIAIIGGGIAGLWLINLLRNQGYNACLVENQALGGSQTLASQGMIHGGIKYTLGGALTDASETIGAMPARWQSCLKGEGDLDLSSVKTLSRDYYLFSDARLTSKVTALFGSRMVKGRVSPVDLADAPAVFQDPGFGGLLYKLEDLVIDIESLISQLAASAAGGIYTGSYEICHAGDRITSLIMQDGTSIEADQYILAAGNGNGEIIKQLGLPVRMQQRPLNQVIVSGGNLPELYAHAVTLRTADKPRLTITTHAGTNGPVWYLGGQLAETGVSRTDEDQIQHARKELDLIFPWVSFDPCDFSCWRIDRAEPDQKDQSRPDTPYVGSFSNTIVCWPTKLTLAPMLGDMVLRKLGPSDSNQAAAWFEEAPAIGTAPWTQIDEG